MIFILYKVSNDNMIFAGAFESRVDAEDKQRLLKNDMIEDFKIIEIPFWTHKEYNKINPGLIYSEEDNNIDEED